LKLHRVLTFIVASIALVACGDDAPAPVTDPECEAARDTAWSCTARFQSTRTRCVDGRYEVETCDADKWCASMSTFQAQTTYEGQCIARSIESRCDSSTACPDGLICWRDRCHIDCDVPRDFCLLEGQRCIAASFGELGYKSLCYDEDDL
jgi:hypothetical protein